MTITADDIQRVLGFGRYSKAAEPDDSLTLNKYPMPPVTTADVVNSVCHNKGGWRTLQSVHDDSVAEERRKIRDRYVVELQEIPEPEWDIPDELK